MTVLLISFSSHEFKQTLLNIIPMSMNELKNILTQFYWWRQTNLNQHLPVHIFANRSPISEFSFRKIWPFCEPWIPTSPKGPTVTSIDWTPRAVICSSWKYIGTLTLLAVFDKKRFTVHVHFKIKLRGL